MTGSAPLIEARGVRVLLGGREALRDVDVDVRDGEILTLIGPNGAGKTTLVRVLLGLVAPDAGRVRRRPGLTVGYLPQSFAVDPALPLTVRRLLSLTRGAPESEMRKVLAEAGAGELLDRPVQGLSAGERQRALLARALLGSPDLLILDEPDRNMDVTGQLALYRLVVTLRERRGCAVVMISHDLHVVMAATDRVLCLNTHVCCSGRPEAVARRPEYLALFGPRTADAIAVYGHRHDHEHDIRGEAVPAAARGGA